MDKGRDLLEVVFDSNRVSLNDDVLVGMQADHSEHRLLLGECSCVVVYWTP